MLPVVIKRILPFVLTFALGLLIASFFVSLSAPHFKFNRRYDYEKQRDCKMRRLQLERDAARDELNRLRHLREAVRDAEVDFDSQLTDELVPPPPPVAPRGIRAR